MKEHHNNRSRREFIKKSTIAGAGIMLSSTGISLAAGINNVRTKGFAAKDSTGKLSKWEFERRPVGDDDILIEIKYAGICHSDIHTVRQDWGPVKYPVVPGHEIAGVVSAVGKNVTKFKVGDHAGVGCMVNSCGTCNSCKKGEEQYCDNHATLYTYGQPEASSPTGITQGGYANNIVVKETFAIQIPKSINLKDAAPLLCAGITTYSPLMREKVGKGMKVGVAGIGGLGHMAVKLAVSKGAEVYAFTTSPEKVADIRKMGVKEVVVVDSPGKLMPYSGQLDFMISTIPAKFNLNAYAAMVKPFGHFTQVGLPATELSIMPMAFAFSRVHFNSSNIGGIPQTQEVMNYCAENNILPQVEVIPAEKINEAYDNVINKLARYRYVIDIATI